MQGYLDFHVQGYANLDNADARWCVSRAGILTRMCLEGLTQGCTECTVKYVFKLPSNLSP